jgi:hypothetical protein
MIKRMQCKSKVFGKAVNGHCLKRLVTFKNTDTCFPVNASVIWSSYQELYIINLITIDTIRQKVKKMGKPILNIGLCVWNIPN